MKILRHAEEARAFSREQKQMGKKLAFVPTMGYLHEGHMSLVSEAGQAADSVMVSIYVNPTQFGPNEDLDQYPRNLERDLELCRKAGVNAVFNPDNAEIYPAGNTTSVEVGGGLTDFLCGKFRPGHFRGVATVVSILFNITEPDIAVFGQKDAQQAVVIKRMCRDLNFPIEILVAPINREDDGLARSSRNTYLSSEERNQATIIYQSLKLAQDLFRDGERRSDVILSEVKKMISSAPLAKIQYVELVNPDDLQPLAAIVSEGLLATGVFFGSTRLIDNTLLKSETGEQ